MKKTAFLLYLTALGILAGVPAQAQQPSFSASSQQGQIVFTGADLNPFLGLEQDSLALGQDIDQTGRTKVSSKDLQQLMCLDTIELSLVHIQGIITREREVLQMETSITHPDDEKKIQNEQTTDISADLVLLKGYEQQTADAVKMCPKNDLILGYAQKVNSIDDRAVSSLASFQVRLKH